jgi:hypothetical protein
MSERPDPLESLKSRLYAPRPIEIVREDRLRPLHEIPHTTWERTPAPPPPKKRMSFATMFLIGAVGFFVVAAAIAAVLYLRGSRAISSDNISIVITSPSPTIASGDTVPITFTIKNNNPATLTSTGIMVDFPPGTREAGDLSKAEDHYSDSLGDMPAGVTIVRSASAVFFGGQDQVISIPVRFQYHTAGSNALFSATKTYTLTISTSPVSLQIQSLSELASGQSFTVTASVHSNATVPLEDIALIATYPGFGFAFTGATPKATTGSFYTLGTLAPGETKTVKIQGVLTGLQGDARTFAFAVGQANVNGTATLAAPYTNSSATVAITQPFIGSTLSINLDTSDSPTVPAGTRVAASLTWKNNLTVPVANAEATVVLSGSGFDPSSILATGGFYNSSARSILFSSANNPNLTQLAPGDSAVGTFTFLTKSATDLSRIQNPTVVASVSVAGTRTGQGNVSSSVTSGIVRTIKIATGVAVSSTLSHENTIIANTGPTPPVSGTETTYTVTLTAANSLNSVGAAEASMVLPPYVRFTGQTVPSGVVSYDAPTRTVKWAVGDVAPGATAKASFQVAFLPSDSQKNTSPIIVRNVTFTGTDRFTNGTVTASAPELTLSQQTGVGFTATSGTVHS